MEEHGEVEDDVFSGESKDEENTGSLHKAEVAEDADALPLGLTGKFFPFSCSPPCTLGLRILKCLCLDGSEPTFFKII